MREPLPKPIIEAICVLGSVGGIAQFIFCCVKGYIPWGHPDGSVGPGSWGPPYNRVYKSDDPKKFKVLLWFNALLALAFLIAAVIIFYEYDA